MRNQRCTLRISRLCKDGVGAVRVSCDLEHGKQRDLFAIEHESRSFFGSSEPHGTLFTGSRFNPALLPKWTIIVPTRLRILHVDFTYGMLIPTYSGEFMPQLMHWPLISYLIMLSYLQ